MEAYKEIKELNPNIVWKYFVEILKIPRASKREEKIILYLENFARTNNLEYKKDSVGNILIIRPADKGMENIESVVLQSHVDMVCEKNKEVLHNFDTDFIKAYIENGWVKARGTTLGADNGIGVACQLAVLTDKSIHTGIIECLFTVDEETGLTGAKNLESGFFKSRILINLDSEDEGEIFIGCAGGVDSIIRYEYQKERTPENTKSFKLSISKLKGGHSGDDISNGFENANKLLIRILWHIDQQFDVSINIFEGGNLRNAIPREAYSIFVVEAEKEVELQKYIQTLFKTIKEEINLTETNAEFELSPTVVPNFVLTKKEQKELISALYICPNGVISMSKAVPDLVETSSNLASIKFFEDNVIEIITSQRSSVESQKEDIANRIKSTFNLKNSSCIQSEGYPGWTPNPDSNLLRIAARSYVDIFEKEAKIKAIHAGLECGLFLEKYPFLDMISIGPTLRGVHSPDERLEIKTVDEFWIFLIEILKNLPKK